MNYPYYNNYFQPQRQELIKVNGIEGAKNYPLSPGSTVALFDAESDIMYIKSMDAGGFPSIRTFTFSEAISTPPSDMETRISSLETEIANLKEALNGIKSVPRQNQINQLQMQNALCGVVRYPMASTWNAGSNPFCGCGCAC